MAELARRITGPLDVLINNAGVGFGADRRARETSHDGFELRLAVNYLAPFVLTRRLLARGLPTRAVVNVASIGQQALDLDDLQTTHDYDGVRAYCRSKLALIMFTLDLAHERPALTCNALHPGTYLDTGMVRAAGITPLGPASEGVDSILHVLGAALTSRRRALTSTSSASPAPTGRPTTSTSATPCARGRSSWSGRSSETPPPSAGRQRVALAPLCGLAVRLPSGVQAAPPALDGDRDVAKTAPPLGELVGHPHRRTGRDLPVHEAVGLQLLETRRQHLVAWSLSRLGQLAVAQRSGLEHVEDERVPGAPQHLQRQLEGAAMGVNRPGHLVQSNPSTIQKKVP